MKVVGNILFIVFTICLIISLFLYVSPTNSEDQWHTVGLSDLFYIIDNAPTFDIGWVDDVIRVNGEDTFLEQHEYGDPVYAGDYNLGVSADIAKFFHNLFGGNDSDIITFVNDWLLAPIKLMFVLGTIGVNVFICIGYGFTVIF